MMQESGGQAPEVPEAGGSHGLFVMIKRQKQQCPIRESLNQIEKDRQWLESKTEPPQS